MLQKIANSLVHGNFRTKLFLWSVIALGTAALILLAAALALGMPALGAGAAGFGFVGLVTSQSVSLKDLEKPHKKKTSKPKVKEPADGSKGQSSDSSKEQENGSKERNDRLKKEQEIGRQKSNRYKKEQEKTKFLHSVDAKTMKKNMKKHKVNQIHVKVMVDSYPEKQIEQSPAVVWRTDTMLHFMIMSAQVEEFEVPLMDIKGILLVKNVPADPQKDYAFYKYNSFIGKMFRPFLPAYREKNNQGNLEFTKNTFRIDPGIYLTNTSVANLQSVLLPDVAFLVDDKVTSSTYFNEYFKEVYRNSILCKNGIINLEGYKEKVEITLDALLTAPISGEEFVQTLRELKKYHLITQQYVTEYTQKYRTINMDKTN
jgi:hypothetical protein